MFARVISTQSARAVLRSAPVTNVEIARGMATLKELKLRISSTKNIQKITKSMKMIASTKLVRAQREMERARVYGAAATALFQHAETPEKPQGEGKSLIVAISSDKGLCGGIHSSITRKIRTMVTPTTDLISIGDKCKVQLARQFGDKIVTSFAAVGSKSPIFLDALLIGDVLLRAASNYNSITFVYNRFKSVIQFDTSIQPVYTVPQLAASEKLDQYEMEDDVLQNLQEFSVANILYATMADGFASETAAKMTAMDNATRNAGDLIAKLTIVYNRTRQAAITTELVDIITGASAL